MQGIEQLAGFIADSSRGMSVIGFTGASHSYPAHADKLTDAGAETVISRMNDLPGVAALAAWEGVF